MLLLGDVLDAKDGHCRLIQRVSSVALSPSQHVGLILPSISFPVAQRKKNELLLPAHEQFTPGGLIGSQEALEKRFWERRVR